MDKFDLKKYLTENKLNEVSNSNSSSVEWFADKIDDILEISSNDSERIKPILEQAKKMEKKQIIDAFEFAQNDLGMEADEYINYMNLKD